MSSKCRPCVVPLGLKKKAIKNSRLFTDRSISLSPKSTKSHPEAFYSSFKNQKRINCRAATVFFFSVDPGAHLTGFFFKSILKPVTTRTCPLQVHSSHLDKISTEALLDKPSHAGLISVIWR